MTHSPPDTAPTLDKIKRGPPSTFTPGARISGGTPSSLPDYAPINKMSRDEIRTLLGTRYEKPRLYQLWVDWKGRGAVPISPKCELNLAEALRATVLASICSGREQLWSNPSVIPVDAIAGVHR